MEKVAIVIIGFNNLAYSRITLESILKNTTVPYKLFLVDNGSTDGTLEYFNSLKENTSIELEVIHSTTNLGFSGGNNLALKEIQNNPEFTHVLLLNNDTIVTKDYLERFLYHLESNKHSGMVGAVSNYAGGMQHVGNIHVPPEDTQKVAEEIYQKNKNKSIETSMLVGFCVLIKREVIDQIGILDESIGTAMHEDNDLCLRAKLAGYKLYVAKDVFIYHFGSKTVNSAFNGRNQFLKTREAFRNKWAAIRSKTPDKIVGMLRVKNGGEILRQTLEAQSKICDSIVIFDDHSTDNTEEICRSFPKVVDYYKSEFPDFNEARDRNFVFDMAKKQNPTWCFCIDHDEVPSDRLIRDIHKVIQDPKNVEVDLFCFKIAHLWNSENTWRKDGLWKNFLQGRLFRVYPNQEIKGNDEGLHCGSHPYFSPMQIKIVPYTIWHYGNMDKLVRFKKYLWYTATDKDKDVNAILGGWKEWYRNLYKYLDEQKQLTKSLEDDNVK